LTRPWRASAAVVGVAVIGWCGWTASAHPRISTSLTWRADIEPLFARQCGACHGASASATAAPTAMPIAAAAAAIASSSLPLSTYADVRPWAAAIREEVLERRMPPAHARPGLDPGVDDHPLSPMERDLIVAWIDGGAPEGQPGAPPTAAFWCPMHPEIRADQPGACPLCDMPLSAFAPDLTRRYTWSFQPPAITSPGRPHRVMFSITERPGSISEHPIAGQHSRTTTRTGTPVRRFERVHEHPLHLFVVSEDFSSFEHVHPTPPSDADPDARWSMSWRPPARGRYWFYADFLPIGGPPQLLQRVITVGDAAAGPHAAPARSTASARETRVAVSGGVEATLTAPPLRAGDEHRLTIDLRDAATQSPVTDLELYLGAWGHLFVLHEQRDEALHAHPDAEATIAKGPGLAFDVLFPRAGTYYLWTQVSRRGAIVTLPFVLRVLPRA